MHSFRQPERLSRGGIQRPLACDPNEIRGEPLRSPRMILHLHQGAESHAMRTDSQRGEERDSKVVKVFLFFLVQFI
jgi:hypothetical protein